MKAPPELWLVARRLGDLLSDDMMAVVDARPELLDEIKQAPADVRDFIAEEVSRLLGTQKFLHHIPAYLEGDPASQARRPLLLAKLRQIAGFRSFAEGAPVPSPSRPASSRVTPSVRVGPTLGGVEPPAPAYVFLRSSSVRAAGYDPASRVLTIEFLNGRV